ILLATTAWGQNNSMDKNRALDPENLLVDVRTPSEYASGHIKNAVNIPFNKIAEDIKYFAPDKEKTIVVYCQSGGRANFAAKKLKDLGYRNIINAGKYKDLKALEAKQE
ncbi:rhodanese-like domain-containing protein, partial [Thermodesulfobacteriota bacterium]